jgi:hypothetical protein
LLHSVWPNKRFLLPEFNCLKNLLQQRMRSNTPFNIVILHEIWRDQIWWNDMKTCRLSSIFLGTYSEIFVRAPNDCPPWEFAASLL